MQESGIKSVKPSDLSVKDLHAYLLGAVCPRPIAFASTIDSKGNPNLSPFSYFNVFSSNPPVLVFSPARRVRDNTTKHTLENAKSEKEVVINIVNYDISQQMVLSSTEYPKEVNEFEKSGFTPLKSEIVKPFRVKESPVQFECRVKDIIALGKEGGAGNLIICEVVYIHIQEYIFDKDGKIDPYKIDTIARLGGIWYTRAREGLFQIKTPAGNDNVGLDRMPEDISNSKILTGNELGKLGKMPDFPTREEVEILAKDDEIAQLLSNYKDNLEALEEVLHIKALELIKIDKIEKAWKVLFLDKLNRLK